MVSALQWLSSPFDWNHQKLLGTSKKLAKDLGKMCLFNICQQSGTYGRKTWLGWLLKLKICTEANQTLLFKMLQNNFFGSCPLHDFTISQMFSFNRTTEPHYIQLVKIFKTHPSTNLIKLYAIDIYVILGLYSMTILKFVGLWEPNDTISRRHVIRHFLQAFVACNVCSFFRRAIIILLWLCRFPKNTSWWCRLFPK